MTYQQLLDYFDKMTNLEKQPKEKFKWTCFKTCGVPCYEKVHFMLYMHRRLKEEYVKFSKSTDYKEEIPKVVKKKNGKDDEECNACKFTPVFPEKFLDFLNRPDITADKINVLFRPVNDELATWICTALGLSDTLGLNSGKKLKSLSWKINGEDVRVTHFDEKFWKERLNGN